MEMGDHPNNKQICRLCLHIVPAADAEAIGEKKKTILDVLLINDLHIIENAVACSRCMEELQSGFEFKSACLHVDNCISTFADANVPVDIKEVFHGVMSGTAMADVNLDISQICRLCMSLIADGALDCNLDLKDMLANCLPEVDMHTVYEPLVCGLCFSRMKKLNEFMMTCQEVERRINNYCQAAADHAIPVSVNLNDLLKFKDSTISSLIKEECSNFDSYTLKNLKKEDIDSIECEEIHIKTEFGGCDAMGESVPLGAYDNIGQHFSSDGHMAGHRGLAKEFACQKCTYKSDWKHVLAGHMVTHKDKSEVETYKCDNCEFETRYKRNIITHMLKHRVTKAAKKFKCDKCPYETDVKSHMRKHDLIHKQKSEVETHKCENCEFETRHKRSMILHMVRHRDPRAERKFKCDKCSYETDFMFSLRRHSLIHKDKSEVEMHKCENCAYATKRKDSLIQHMVTHREPKAQREFKCDKCTYETDFKFHLLSHNLVHMDKSEVKMYMCDNCEFATMRKSALIKHMLTHRHVTRRDPKAERRFKCDKCSYETDFKFHLHSHSLIHMDKSEVNMYMCDNCEFATMRKSHLIKHMVKHRHPLPKQKKKI